MLEMCTCRIVSTLAVWRNRRAALRAKTPFRHFVKESNEGFLYEISNRLPIPLSFVYNPNLSQNRDLCSRCSLSLSLSLTVCVCTSLVPGCLCVVSSRQPGEVEKELHLSSVHGPKHFLNKWLPLSPLNGSPVCTITMYLIICMYVGSLLCLSVSLSLCLSPCSSV